MSKNLSFSEALLLCKFGGKITRVGWNGKGLWIESQYPDETSKNTRPYLFINTPANSTAQFGEDGSIPHRVPWFPSQTDMFAIDWETVE